MKALISFVCLLLWAGAVVGDCLGNCNDHGRCVEEVCQCDVNWAGDDCSIYDKYLNSDEVALDSIAISQWKFYRHEVQSSGSTLTWWLNQTGSGDPDLYLAYGEYPTLRNFLIRNITRSDDSLLVVENVRQGMYYAGVYGYSTATYNIKVTESRECQDNCHDHGTCVDGTCSCFPNFGGDFCQYTFKRLTEGSPLVGQVEQGEWEYFYTDVVKSGSDLLYTVTELSEDSSSDCDLYAAFERTPTLVDWDYANITLGHVSTIHITNALYGQYTLAINGFSECSFRVSVALSSPLGDCPNRCSSHGTCIGGECSCDNGFSGDICESMEAPLALARPQTGYVGQSAWNYYTTRIITNTPFIITLTQQGEGDCDLYVRADEAPTRFKFNYIDQSVALEFSIVVREPGDHLWYIGVFGWRECAYDIVVDEALVCACGENNEHGSCEEGSTECLCQEGWAGPTCSYELVTLQNGEKASSSVRQYGWKHFQLPVNHSSAGVVSLKENSSTGLLWLFVSFLEPPTVSNFDVAAKETDESVHEIQISVSQSQSRVMYIGVYGNSFITHTEKDFGFDLYAWASPF